MEENGYPPILFNNYKFIPEKLTKVETQYILAVRFIEGLI